MHETSKTFNLPPQPLDESKFLLTSSKRILERANLALLGAFRHSDSIHLRFAGVTSADNTCCLAEVIASQNADKANLRVNTESVALGLQLAEDLAGVLSGDRNA